MDAFLISARYWGAVIVGFIGAAIVLIGETVIDVGRWIGGRA